MIPKEEITASVLLGGNNMKKCKHCGEKIKIGFVKRMKFCSVECRNAYYKAQSQKDRKCLICGGQLTGTQSKYCSNECSKKAAAKKQTEKNERYKKPPTVERKKAKKPSLSLAQVNELARAEGLNYGQYCAKYGL